MHVYDWIDTPNKEEVERDVKRWLGAFSQPAYTKYKNKVDQKLAAQRITCVWNSPKSNGGRYRLVGCSRMGDVWLKAVGSVTRSFYDHRVNILDLSDWQVETVKHPNKK